MNFTVVYNLTNLIKVSTRVVVESSSLTDVIPTNKPRSVLTSGVFDLGLIDHNLNLHCYAVTMSKIHS